MVNFKIYDVRTYLTNNYNVQIAQYLTKERQPDNENWSVNISLNKGSVRLHKSCRR